MKILHVIVTSGALAAALVLATATRAEDTPACVKATTQVVAVAYGYNHVVTLENTCTRAAACTVSTDVAPDPIQATVEAKQKVDLVTFRGSPASSFKAKVECKLK
jgi:hypothetical protein